MILSLILTAACAPAAQDAPALTPEFLTAHPDVLAGRWDAFLPELWSALEAAPDGPLFRDGVQLLGKAQSAASGSHDVQRLMDLARRTSDAQASVILRILAAFEVGRTRFAPEPQPPLDDPYSEFVTDWRWFGGTGPADHPAPQLLPDLADGPEAWSVEMPDNPWTMNTEWAHVARLPHQMGVNVLGRPWPANGCTYLAAIVRAPVSKLQVEVYTSGAARAWWNGTRLFDAPRVDPKDTRTRFLYEVPARSGWNLLLLRIPTEQDDEVGARFLNLRGQPIEVEEYPWGETMPFPMEPLRCEPREVDDVHPLSGDDPFHAALRVRRHANDGRHDRALAVPAPAEGAALTAWRLERLNALLEAPHLPPETARRAVVELENVFETEGPWLPTVRMTRALRLQQEDRPAEALEIVRELIETDPDSPLYALVEAMMLGDLDPRGFLAQPAFEAVAARWPEEGGAHLRIARHRLEQRDWPGAWEATRAALAASGNEGRVLELAVELATQDALAAHQLRAHLERWAEAEPGNQLPLDLMARVDTRLGDNEAALVRLRERQTLAHVDHAFYHLELGDAYARLGRLPEAHDHWNAAVAFVPAARRVWTSLELTGVSDHAETFFREFGPDVEAAIAGAEAFAGLSVVEALDSGMVYVLPDGSAIERFHTISVVGDRTGAEQLHEHPVQDGVRVARVRKPDGTLLEPTDVNGTWVLPAIEPGDAVEYVWDVEVPVGFGVPTELGRWRFQSFDKPFARSRYVIYVPKIDNPFGPPGEPGELRLFHFDGTHETIQWHGGTVHVLERSSERASDEVLRPSDWEILPWLVYAADRDPQSLAGAWQAQLAALASLPEDLHAEIDAWLEPFAAIDGTLERAAAIHAALDARVTDAQGAALAAHVWPLRRGNSLYLFAALCERAGVPTRWALLDGGFAPQLAPEPVRAYQGDGVDLSPILLVGEPGGANAWVLASPQPGAAFGVLPSEVYGCPAWILGEDGAVEETEVPLDGLADIWDLDLFLTYTLEANGDASVEGRLRFPNFGGGVLKHQLGMANAEQRSGYARQVLGQVIAGIEPSGFEFPELDGPPGPAELRFTGRVPQFVQPDPQGHRADLRVPLRPVSRELGPAERDWPLALRLSQRTRLRVRVLPGDAWRLVSAPEPFSDVREGYQHVLETTTLDDGWEVLRTFVLRGAYFEADEVPAFLLRMRELEESELTPLRFEPVR